MVALGLRCYERAFSSCDEWGLLFDAMCRLLIVVASLVTEHREHEHGLQQLQHSDSVVVAPVVALRHVIFPDQGLNRCPLHW